MLTLRYRRPRARRRRASWSACGPRWPCSRDELATVRTRGGEVRTRLAKMRAARNRRREVGGPPVVGAGRPAARSTAASRAASTACSPAARARPTDEEQRELELIRSSPLFDAAWYLRHYHDVVRSGEEPALHFLRHPTRPIRAPGPDFDTARYLDAHPEVLDRRHQPADPLPAHRRGPTRRAATRPGAGDRRCPTSRSGGAAAPTSSDAGSRSSTAGSAPTATDPARARGLVERGARRRAAPSRRRERAARPRRPAALRDGRGPARAAPSTPTGYVARPTGSATRRVDPLPHFVDEGWRDLRAPSLDFDLWWYWCSYLDPTAEDVNPLLHYLLVGRHEGLEPVPGPPPERDAHPTTTGRTPRRACLFAAYDRDGIVDDYVVDYLRELARHADVFYLADGVLEPGELDKLDGRRAGRVEHPARAPTTSAPGRCWPATWSAGSGLDGYDEVVLANDSCFLVRPLDEVFAEMDAPRLRLVEPAGDLDGVQRGRRRRRRLDAARRGQARAGRPAPLVRRALPAPELVLPGAPPSGARRPGLPLPARHRRADSAPSSSVVDKYEIGISRYLMDSGFEFDTWSTRPLPVPPAVLAALLRPRRRAGSRWSSATSWPRTRATSPGFAAWPDWLPQRGARGADGPDPGQHRPGLARRPRSSAACSPRWTSDRAPACVPQRPLAGYGFRWMAEEEPKFAALVGLPGHRRRPTGWTPGARALLRGRPRRPDDPQGRADPVAPLRPRRRERRRAADRHARGPGSSWRGAARSWSTGRRAPRSTCPLPRAMHQFVHVGSGLPDRRPDRAGAGRGSNAFTDAASDYRRLNAMVAASQGRRAGQGAATPLNLHQLWLTGLPRHDLVTRRRTRCPTTCAGRSRSSATGSEAGGCWCCGRDPGRSPHAPSTTAQRDWLAAWCRRHDVVLGVREAPVDRAGSWTQPLHAARGLGALGPAACPIPRSCSGWPTPWSPTTPTRPSTSC